MLPQTDTTMNVLYFLIISERWKKDLRLISETYLSSEKNKKLSEDSDLC